MFYTYELTYPFEQAITVRQLLQRLLIPRKWQHELRSSQQILINGAYRSMNQLVEFGDQIQLQLTGVQTLQGEYPASGKLPKIIYEDADLLVIDKPAGQKTHPNQQENGTALNDCATYLHSSPFIVHRLDMLTSGLLLVAKNPAVVPILNRQLARKTFQRHYYAKVIWNPALPLQGTIDQPLGQDSTDQRKRMVTADGLKSVTHYEVANLRGQIATLKIDLETGRTHQIRVHLQSLGIPIIGDPLYNPNYQAGQKLELVAYEMELTKPFSFQTLTIKLH